MKSVSNGKCIATVHIEVLASIGIKDMMQTKDFHQLFNYIEEAFPLFSMDFDANIQRTKDVACLPAVINLVAQKSLVLCYI